MHLVHASPNRYPPGQNLHERCDDAGQACSGSVGWSRKTRSGGGRSVRFAKHTWCCHPWHPWSICAAEDDVRRFAARVARVLGRPPNARNGDGTRTRAWLDVPTGVSEQQSGGQAIPRGLQRETAVRVGADAGCRHPGCQLWGHPVHLVASADALEAGISGRVGHVGLGRGTRAIDCGRPSLEIPRRDRPVAIISENQRHHAGWLTAENGHFSEARSTRPWPSR